MSRPYGWKGRRKADVPVEQVGVKRGAEESVFVISRAALFLDYLPLSLALTLRVSSVGSPLSLDEFDLPRRTSFRRFEGERKGKDVMRRGMRRLVRVGKVDHRGRVDGGEGGLGGEAEALLSGDGRKRTATGGVGEAEAGLQEQRNSRIEYKEEEEGERRRPCQALAVKSKAEERTFSQTLSW